MLDDECKPTVAVQAAQGGHGIGIERLLVPLGIHALEAGAEVILKATKVEGVYDADPKKVTGANRYERIGFDRVLGESAEPPAQVAQRIDAGVRLEDAGPGRTLATAFVDGPFWRLFAEGARGVPRQAVARLYDLCQTASTL